MDLPIIEDCNKDNLQLLKRYNTIIKNKGLTQESIKAINIDLKLLLRYLGDTNIKEINHINIEDFIDYLQEERKNSPQTIGRKFVSMNSFFKTLIKKEYLPDSFRNPLDKIDKIKTRKKVRGHLTEEEISKLFTYLEEINDLRGLAFFSLALSSGCRLSELWQLNRNALDLDKRRFIVLGKGQKQRICIFSEDAKNKILKYLESRTDDIDALFISRQNTRLSKRQIQRYVKSICSKAGIDQNVFPHLLRHSLAMLLLHKNLPIDKISKVLGHESISTTQIYCYNTIDDVQDLVDDITDKINY